MSSFWYININFIKELNSDEWKLFKKEFDIYVILLNMKFYLKKIKKHYFKYSKLNYNINKMAFIIKLFILISNTKTIYFNI